MSKEYTIYHQLNDNKLYIKVINNILMGIYETFINQSKFPHKLTMVDKLLSSKKVIINYILLKNQLLLNCCYKNDIVDIEFDITLDQIQVDNVDVLQLNKKIFELENELTVYKQQLEELNMYKIYNPIIIYSATNYYKESKFYNNYTIILNDNFKNFSTILDEKSKECVYIEHIIKKINLLKQNQIYNSHQCLNNITELHYTFSYKSKCIIPPNKFIKFYFDNDKPKILKYGKHCCYSNNIRDDYKFILLGDMEYYDLLSDNYIVSNPKTMFD